MHELAWKKYEPAQDKINSNSDHSETEGGEKETSLPPFLSFD